MCTACFGTAAQFLFSWVEVGEAAGLVLKSSSPCPRFSACGCKRRNAMLRHSLASVPVFCCGKGFSLQQQLLCFIMSDALSRLCPVLSLHWLVWCAFGCLRILSLELHVHLFTHTSQRGQALLPCARQPTTSRLRALTRPRHQSCGVLHFCTVAFWAPETLLAYPFPSAGADHE